MGNELYFIPIIDGALTQPDPKAALVEAFETIKDMGEQPDYQEGFQQFQRFINASAESAARSDGEEPTDEEALLECVTSHPEWKEEYESFCAELEPSLQSIQFPVIEVERDGNIADRISFERIPASGSIKELVPGTYRLKFDTGRDLWEGELTAEDLIWSAAFPGRPLQLAADTGETASPPSREFPLLGGEIAVRIFPGVESGRMEITVQRPADH